MKINGPYCDLALQVFFGPHCHEPFELNGQEDGINIEKNRYPCDDQADYYKNHSAFHMNYHYIEVTASLQCVLLSEGLFRRQNAPAWQSLHNKHMRRKVNIPALTGTNTDNICQRFETNVPGTKNVPGTFVSCARQGALTRRCKTAAGLIGGTASHNRKGVRREAESEGSERQTTGSTNRKHIEADMLGEKANRFKAQYLYGKHRRRCAGHKWESKCALPGEVCNVSLARKKKRKKRD
jgi:glutaredoxin-related protein